MKTDFMVISFSPNGEVNALHRDTFDLGFLGKQKIERASDIRFNEKTQSWDIYLFTGQMIHDGEVWQAAPEACGFPTYSTARDAEVGWLEACALQGIAPLSDDGRRIIRMVRDTVAGSGTGPNSRFLPENT